jgi:hypothetical protein
MLVLQVPLATQVPMELAQLLVILEILDLQEISVLMV